MASSANSSRYRVRSPMTVLSATALIAVAAAGMAMAGGPTSVAPSSHDQPATRAARDVSNPRVSMAPSAAFDRYCFAAGHRALCNAAALADIDQARRSEHLAPLRLPRGFAARSVPSQLITVADLERTARRLPTMAPKPALDVRAHAGATAAIDPSGPTNYTWGSNLASGYATPLAADFGWMYDDGLNSPNGDCTTAASAACWAHRDNIVAPWAGAQGTAEHTNKQGTLQLTQLFVKNY